VWLVIIGFFFVIYLSHDLPDLDKLYENKLRPSVVILDAQGNEILSRGDLKGEYLEFNQLPSSLVNAVVSVEDRRFFRHSGIDIRGLIRAIYINITNRSFKQGGSSITQQLAKIAYLSPKRTLKRKIQEAMLAFWLEQKFTKQQIFEMYINRTYFGSGTYGVDAASQRYFGKSAKYLNLYESALIAGLLKAPSRYSPLINKERSALRTEEALAKMVAAGYIDEREKRNASSKDLLITTMQKTDGTAKRYFTDYVLDLIPNKIAPGEHNIIVHTTLQPALQNAAEEAVTVNFFNTPTNKKVSQAALLSINKNGAIVVMIGGVDYAQSQFNRVTQAKRQPGSLFKIFTYMAAFEHGFNPQTLVEDKPIKVKKWQPKNYDNKFKGHVSLKDALAASRNVPAVIVNEYVGRDKAIAMAQRFGIDSKLRNMPSTALGTSEVTLMEIVRSFAYLAASGKKQDIHAITKITTPDGDVLYKRKRKPEYQLITNKISDMINDCLLAVAEYGTAKNIDIERDIAGKTGTTQDYRDAWFVGFTPNYTTGVWVGNDSSNPMQDITGGSLPAKIWQQYMLDAHDKLPEAKINRWRGDVVGD